VDVAQTPANSRLCFGAERVLIPAACRPPASDHEPDRWIVHFTGRTGSRAGRPRP